MFDSVSTERILVLLKNGLGRASVLVICNSFRTFLDAYTDEISVERDCSGLGTILEMLICCCCTYIL